MAGRARQQHSALATKTAMAEAAAREFMAHGYAGASLSGIAERLGVTKGALVYHFRATADFVAYLVGVARAATAQADAFARAEYPERGSQRLLLYILLMADWIGKEAQLSAGIALCTDAASPTIEAGDVVQDWQRLSLDALSECKARGELGHMSAQDAAEFFLVATLGVHAFGRYLPPAERGAEQLRFVKLALTAVGVTDVEGQVREVVETHATRLPAFRPSL